MSRPTVDERRAEILEATCAVVIERGFAGTRISDVANRLGVSTGLIHYHFDSKEQLLAEAFRYARQEMERSRPSRLGPNAVARLDRRSRTTRPTARRSTGCCGSTRGARHCATR